MRKVIFVLSLAAISTQQLLAQSVPALDTANGFRQFKFGLKPRQIKDIKHVRTAIYRKDFVREYSYTGNDIADIGGIKVSSIILSFYETRLFGIRILFDYLPAGEVNTNFEKIQSVLAAQYGTSWAPIVTDKDEVMGKTLKGEKVVLDEVMNKTGSIHIDFINRRRYKEVMADK